MDSFTESQQVDVGSISVGGGGRLVLIAGPCVIEHADMARELAVSVAKTAQEFGVPAIFKASFDKANRQSLTSFRGPGMDAGLAVLREVREESRNRQPTQGVCPPAAACGRRRAPGSPSARHLAAPAQESPRRRLLRICTGHMPPGT